MPAATMEGKHVPEVTWPIYKDGKWSQLTTDDVFKGKTVAVFSLPGAFTPTCSSTHLPRYDELYHTFKANGVDDIWCVSVNDSFVMNSWGEDLGVQHVKLLADGNGEFTDKMGMLVDKKVVGFGSRSWRYSMLVKDGVVEKMFVEPEKEGDPFEVSDADTMLKHIKPDAAAPPPVVIFTKPGCPFCAKAKQLLNDKHLKYEELSGKKSAVLVAMTGRKTVPQVFIGGKHIGGADDLEKYFAADH